MLTQETKPNLLRPRWRKVLSDLWDSKLRTVLVIASIAVGVFAIGMILSAYNIMAEDINISFAAANPVNIEIWTDPFYEDFGRIIERIPGVEDVEGQLVMQIRSRKMGDVWQGVTLIAKDDFEASRINLLTTIDGTQFLGEKQVVVSYDFLNDTGYQVGDEIEIELPDASRHNVTVVGTVTDLATGGGTDPQSGSNAYISFGTLKQFGMRDYFNRLLVTVDGTGGDEQWIHHVASAVEDKLERNQRGVYRTELNLSTENPMASTVLAVLGVLGVLGGLITLLSSSLIINTLNALLTQHLRQIGVMKLIGGRSAQIMGMYLALIFSYGLIALVITVPLGAIAGYWFASFMANMLGAVLQGFRIVPIAIVAQVLIAFLIPLGAGFFPVNKGSRINVRRAISNDRSGNQPTQLDFFNRVISKMQWTSRPLLLSIRNTFRKKGRLLLTIFTLTIAGSVFIGVFNVRASLGNFMDQLMQYFRGDITVSFNQPYSISQVERDLLSLPGIDKIEAWGGARGEIWDENDDVVANLSIIAPPVDTFLLNPDIVAGRWIEPDEEDALVISDSIYEWYPDLQPGDSLLIKLPGNRENNWKVVGVFRFISMLGDPIAYADFDYVARLMKLPNQSASYRLTTDSQNLETQKELSLTIDERLTDRGFLVNNVETGQVMRQDSTEAINILVIFLFAMALLTAFVGSIGLTGTMGMNVLERTREIGVMRAIGAVDFVVVQSVVIEALIIGLITWVLAIGLSFPISFFLLRIIGEAMMGSEMILTITPLGIFIWLGMVVVLSFIASIVPARNAARLTIREVLAYE
ncbi:MAG: FtsX-like permease family protein [Anaerolineales bacterium]|nr:MAG: FtsX-like permease family protein [Anaerolineales bacterium]